MKTTIFGYILAAVLIGFSAYAQMTSDADRVAKTVFDLLCAGDMNLAFKNAHPELFLKVNEKTYNMFVHVEPNRQGWQNRITALNTAMDISKKFLNNKTPYSQVHAQFENESYLGSYFDKNNKKILLQAIGCSPLKVENVIDVDTSNFSGFRLLSEMGKACARGEGYQIERDSSCQKICKKPNEHLVIAENIDGKLVRDNSSSRQEDLYAGCVPCSEATFGGSIEYGYSGDGNRCVDINKCDEGYSARDIKMTVSMLKKLQDNFQDKPISIDSSDLMANSHRLALNEESTAVHICAQKCGHSEVMDENGTCKYSRKKSCENLNKYAQKLNEWDPLSILNDFEAFQACRDPRSEDYLRAIKVALVHNLKERIQKCEVGELDFSLDNNFGRLFAAYDSQFVNFEAFDVAHILGGVYNFLVPDLEIPDCLQPMNVKSNHDRYLKFELLLNID